MMARTVISILSALADQLVGLGQLLVREDFWSAFRLIGGAIILGVLYGVLFGIALVAVAWALLLLLEGFFPAEQVLAIIPETFNRLSVSLLSALVPTSVAAAAVLSVFGSLRFVAIRWGQLWGVARGLLAWIRRTLHRSFRRFRISVRRFVRGVRRFFRQSQREHRAAWRAAYVVTASALLLPVQWFLQFTAWLLVRVSNRRLAEFVSAAMLVVAVPALIDSTRYSERPLPPEAPPEIMTSEPPPSPSVERMVPLSIALCEPRIGGMEWALGRDDRLELPLTACALPPWVKDEYGTLVVIGAASRGVDESKEIDRALRRGSALAAWSSAQLSPRMRVFVLNLGMAKRDDAFRRGGYLWGASGGGRTAVGIVHSVTPRDAVIKDSDIANALRNEPALTEIARDFTTCDLYALDTTTITGTGPRLVPVADFKCENPQ